MHLGVLHNTLITIDSHTVVMVCHAQYFIKLIYIYIYIYIYIIYIYIYIYICSVCVNKHIIPLVVGIIKEMANSCVQNQYTNAIETPWYLCHTPKSFCLSYGPAKYHGAQWTGLNLCGIIFIHILWFWALSSSAWSCMWMLRIFLLPEVPKLPVQCYSNEVGPRN